MIVATILLVASLLGGCSSLSSPPVSQHIRYTVKAGDTFSSIAFRFGTSIAEIEAYNRNVSARNLPIGQVLIIPYRGQKIREQSSRPSAKATDPAKPSAAALRTAQSSAAKRYVGAMAWPVPGASLVSRFGRRWLSFHEGIDLAAKEGTPILAAHSGRVAYSGDGLRGYGNLIVLKGDGILTVYGHNRKNLVKVGASVQKGQRIALLGQSGKASGPHLHFEVRVRTEAGKNVAVDPLGFYP